VAGEMALPMMQSSERKKQMIELNELKMIVAELNGKLNRLRNELKKTKIEQKTLKIALSKTPAGSLK
jgi:hypothetical protein